VSAEQIIAGYQQLISQTHAMGLKIFGGTITPFKGFVFWSENEQAAREIKREAVNTWIKESAAFDAVVDFAAAIADPNDPTAIDPRYDAGDHAHPNAAGSETMAGAVELSLFRNE
jgi:lysophospholipase L1-like esterase